ncbi:MAG: hypothetical protein QM820_63810 [Minicystis sp.]
MLVALGDAAEELADEEGHVLAARGEGRYGEAQGEARGEVVLQLVDAAVGGGDDAEIDLAAAGLAEAVVLAAAIEDAEEVRLQALGQLADLVEEERGAVGLADEALALGRAGVGVVLDVAEQLGVEQALGEGGRVAGHERAATARREAVDGAGDQLLAGAALAGDEHVARGRCGEGDVVAEPPRGRALADVAVRVGVAEGEGVVVAARAQRREARGPARDHEEQLVFQVDRVARADVGLPREGAVHEHGAGADRLHRDPIARGPEDELGPRDAGASDGIGGRVHARSLPHERGPRRRVLGPRAAAPEDLLGADEHRFTDAVRLLAGPGQDQRRHLA